MRKKPIKKIFKSRNKEVNEILVDPLIRNTILRDLEKLLLKTYQRGYRAGYTKAYKAKGKNDDK